ncbi:MAG: hypothetical protein EZS28_002241 [Streblomastix strix]|uniref:Reverse transcriptase domain-containing protein n=1 Tax=Streblomastix strix TaxID=222440 RepID=A0A5J4X610_9EUKA|nr:MAG: hypothetical protein EZS28_002241 [Streblomastix strix]
MDGEVLNEKDPFGLEDADLKNRLVPDRLTTKADQWSNIGSTAEIIDGIRLNGVSQKAFHQLESIRLCRSYHGTSLQMMEYQKKLEMEITSEVVVEISNIRILNPTFTVSRTDGKLRKISYCRAINCITGLIKFKMDGVETIKQIMELGDFAITLDLQDAFHYIRVSEQLLPYLGIKFQSRTYIYRGLPFGYRNCPYHFNKILTLALREIRGRWMKLKISNYIDDIILLHPNKNQLKLITIQDTQYVQSLGWKLQQKKCRLYPSTTFIYLDWKWNSITIEVKMPQVRRKMMKSNIKLWIKLTIYRQIMKQRSLAALIGELNILRFQFVDASLYLKSLNLLKFQAIIKGGWNGKLYLNRRILGNLFNWLQKVKLNIPRQLEDLIPSAALTTDAAEVSQREVLQSINLDLMDMNRWTKG